MNIELYPTYDTVFADSSLKGIFYPLLTLLGESERPPLHVVSSNGIWKDELQASPLCGPQFTLFAVDNDRYCFTGSLSVFKGYEEARGIYPLLEEDFAENGQYYLEQALDEDRYISALQSKFMDLTATELDLPYYLSTFYSFAVNKYIYRQTGKLGMYRKVISGWKHQRPAENPLHNFQDAYEELSTNAEYLLPDSLGFENFVPLALAAGTDFFIDGEDSLLLADKSGTRALCMGVYS